MQVNSSYFAKLTIAHNKFLKQQKLMKWFPSYPDINPVEKMRSIIKRNVYENRKQYSSKNKQ